MIENSYEKPRVLLVCVDVGEFDAERSIKELEELAQTAGAETVGTVIQKRDKFDTATCVGSGRLSEISQLCSDFSVDQIIFDHELTATQMRNIEDACKTNVIDRTTLILDIFAQRAFTKEGRLQVELAQQKYRLPRLAGIGTSLSRLGGGIGTRGPGETKLETDRRYIRNRISVLSSQLKEIEKRRGYYRSRRKKDGVLTCAIVGYTNVGKSTLLNTLTDAGVLSENKLFATLETTSRSIELSDGRSVNLVDTVGLISRLPHNLVEAFKSTLEEAASADVILHICDASNEDVYEQAKVTLELLKELGCEGIPVVTVLNKCDLSNDISDFGNNDVVKISAKNGTGIDKLIKSIENALPETAVKIHALLPFNEAGLISKIRIDGKVFSEEYKENGIDLVALVDKKIYHLVEKYKVNN